MRQGPKPYSVTLLWESNTDESDNDDCWAVDSYNDEMES